MQLVHDYIISLVNLYGIVHKEKVIEIYNEQNSAAIDVAMINQVMQEDAEVLAKGFAYIEGNYFVQEAVIIFDDISDVLAERVGKPFYVPPKNELLKYKDEFYFEKTKQYNALLRYVTKHFTGGSRSRAIDICEEIYLMCQQEFAMKDVLESFNRMGVVFESEEQLGLILNLVTDLANHTRLWVNNGHTPKELLSMHSSSQNNTEATLENNKKTKERKVGRNEPCPCGSGKKYKKCCLT